MNFNIQTGYSQDAENNLQQKIQDDIITTVGVFTKDAAELAGTYCLHSGRNSVTIKDIELGLKTRAYYGDMFWNRPDIQQKINEMKIFLNEPGSESESESETETEYDDNYNDDYDDNYNDDDDDEMEEVNEDSQNTAFVQSTCSCAICMTLNEIIPKWNNWYPTEKMEISIKKSIELALSN